MQTMQLNSATPATGLRELTMDEVSSVAGALRRANPEDPPAGSGGGGLAIAAAGITAAATALGAAIGTVGGPVGVAIGTAAGALVGATVDLILWLTRPR
jgi:hypothetical protein